MKTPGFAHHIKLLTTGEIVVKVRLSGCTYAARLGRGKTATTATCTSGESQAAIHCTAKHLKLEDFVARRLVAKHVPAQGVLPGLKLKEEYGVSYWRVGYPVAEGGVL